MTPFIGVRISWLMLARNSLFTAAARVALAQARSAARRAARVRRFCQHTTPTMTTSTTTAMPNSDFCRSESLNKSVSSASLLDW